MAEWDAWTEYVKQIFDKYNWNTVEYIQKK
jgi:hypothetical protein